MVIYSYPCQPYHLHARGLYENKLRQLYLYQSHLGRPLNPHPSSYTPAMAAPLPPGQQPTPQQMAAIQQQIAMEAQRRGMTPQQLQAEQRRQLEAEAQKAGMTFEQYINKLKQQAFEQHQKQQLQAQQQGAAQQQQQGQPQMQGQQGQQVPITPGAPDPRALALAKWLRSQDLKTRTCILNGQRKDMFRGTNARPLSLCTPRVNKRQSNVLSELSSHPHIPKQHPRILSYPLSPIPHPNKKSSNFSPSPSSPSAFPNQIPTKVMITALRNPRNESRVSGPSRSSNNRTSTRIYTTYGYTTVPNGRPNFTLLAHYY